MKSHVLHRLVDGICPRASTLSKFFSFSCDTSESSSCMRRLHVRIGSIAESVFIFLLQPYGENFSNFSFFIKVIDHILGTQERPYKNDIITINVSQHRRGGASHVITMTPLVQSRA